MPSGNPIITHTATDANIAARVSIVSSHTPDKPVKNNKQNATNANHLPAEK